MDSVKLMHVKQSSYDVKLVHTKEGLAWRRHGNALVVYHPRCKIDSFPTKIGLKM
jgi:hypothetical protein